MNQLQVFKSSVYGEIRTIENGANPLFVATDVAKALGYVQPHKAVDRHCRYGTKRTIPHPQNPNKEIEVLAIPQGDILRLVVKSQLPGADKFESWIFDEVIPSVLKTGTYTAKPMSQAEIIAAQANLLVDIERKSDMALQTAESTQKRLNEALEVLSAPPKADWQTTTKNKIVSICKKNNLSPIVVFGDLYRELDYSKKVDITARLRNLRKRMKKAGATSQECKAVSKLHVISQNDMLKLAFDGIVRRFVAKYA